MAVNPNISGSVVALAGGVGGAKLVHGLMHVIEPQQLTVVVNTADDFEHLGLHISPDLDTVMYTLAGLHNPDSGWGLDGETWNFLTALRRLGGETWFNLGDSDLATHVERTCRLRSGEALSEITSDFCARLGVRAQVVPMSDDLVQTVVHSEKGPLPFQDYFVRQSCEPAVLGFQFEGIVTARLHTVARTALHAQDLKAIIICPSNPYVSIAPILELPGVRQQLVERRSPLVAVSPIVGGQAIKGPAAKMMRELGVTPSCEAVSEYYGGLLDGLVIDNSDAAESASITKDGPRVMLTSTIMNTLADKIGLAESVLEFAGDLDVLGT